MCHDLQQYSNMIMSQSDLLIMLQRAATLLGREGGVSEGRKEGGKKKGRKEGRKERRKEGRGKGRKRRKEVFGGWLTLVCTKIYKILFTIMYKNGSPGA